MIFKYYNLDGSGAKMRYAPNSTYNLQDAIYQALKETSDKAIAIRELVVERQSLYNGYGQREYTGDAYAIVIGSRLFLPFQKVDEYEERPEPIRDESGAPEWYVVGDRMFIEVLNEIVKELAEQEVRYDY